MNVLDLLVGRLAVERQLVGEPVLQHYLQQGDASGRGLGDVLLAQGFSNDLVQGLFQEAQHAQLLCAGCGSRWGAAHLNPNHPWGCPRCGTELLLLGQEDSRRMGTGRWLPGQPADSQNPTHTGSDRWPPRAAMHGHDTRPGSGSDRQRNPPTQFDPQVQSGRLEMLGGGLGTTPGTGSWRSQTGRSASQKFRNKLQPGTVVDDYEILSELGRGGMGIVFKARHVHRGQEVALKVLLAGSMASERQRKRFQREAEVLSRLEHPNIVRVFDMGEVGEHLYFTMEFVDGQPLSDQIDAKRVSLRRAVEIARDVALGLEHAHEEGVIHRDIKPDNILMDQSGTPLITDFGLVRDTAFDTTRLTRSGAVLGTPYYMSPEQAAGKGHHLTGAADQYSLGVVLYQMLAGQLPFDGDTQVELTRKIVNDTPPRPSKHNPSIGPGLEAIVLKTLAKEPEDRYENAEDLADDLNRFLQGQRVLAQRTGAEQLILLGKRALLAGGALLLVALLVVGIRAVLPRGGPDPDPKPPSNGGDDERAKRIAAAKARVDETLEEAERTALPNYRSVLWKVLEALNVARGLVPRDAGLAFRRGWVHDRLQKFPEAKADFEEARGLDPGGDVAARAAFYLARHLRREDVARTKVSAMLRACLAEPAQGRGPWRDVVAALADYMEKPEGGSKGALEKLRRVEVRHAQLPEIQAFKSQLFMELGQIEDAFDALQEAVRLDPKDADTWATRASFYMVVRENKELGLKDAERALQLDPENPSALEIRGAIRGMDGNRAASKADFERALKRDPGSEVAIGNLARIYAEEGQFEKGMELLRKAQERAPDRIRLVFLQVEFYMGRSQLRDAARVLWQALGKTSAATSRHAVDRLRRRFEDLALGADQHQLVERLLQERLAQNPGDLYAQALRGDLLVSKKRQAGFPEALALWNRLLKANPTALVVWERRLRVKLTLNEPETVEDEVLRFIRTAEAQKNGRALSYGARYWMVRNDPTRARALARKATDIDPKSGAAWILRAMVELITKRTSAGYTFLQRALTLEPEAGEAYFLKGRAELLLGKTALAVRSFQRAFSLTPFDGERVGTALALLLKEGRFKEVLQICSRHEKLTRAVGASTTPQIALHGVNALLRLNRTQNANALLDEIVVAGVKSSKNVRYLARTLAMARRIPEAKKVLRAHLQKNPRDRRAQLLLEKLEAGPGG